MIFWVSKSVWNKVPVSYFTCCGGILSVVVDVNAGWVNHQGEDGVPSDVPLSLDTGDLGPEGPETS